MSKLFTLFTAAAVSLSAGQAWAQRIDAAETLKVGDKVTIDGVDYLVGRNVITNPNFEMNPADNDGKIVGWNLGTYAQMMATTSGGTFIWQSEGGHDGGPYIQANSHTGAAGSGSIGTRWTVESNSKYYMSFWLAKNSLDNQYIPVISLTSNESTAGGQNETSSNGGKMVIGKNGGDGVTDDCLGYGAYNNGDWAQTQFYFDTDDYTYLQFNARWLKEGDIQACFDDFYLGKLYDAANTPKYELLQIELSTMIAEASDYSSEIENYGLYFTLMDAVDAASDAETSEDEEELETAMNNLEAALTDIKNCASVLQELVALIEANSELTSSGYPGAEAFEEALATANEVLEAENLDYEGYSAALAAFQQAIKDYQSSQEIGDEGADYTFLVSCPNFTKDGGDQTVSDDRASTGWEIGPSGGDQRLNTIGGLNCWNAWRSNFGGSYVDVHQNLTDVPNGKYTLSADMITQSGMAYQQRVYAQTTLNTVTSPYLTEEGWDEGVYTNLTTEGYAIVTDGNLTIGARGEGNPENTDASGWFCVTNFKLTYWGEASEDEIAAANEAKIEEFNTLVAEMSVYANEVQLAGDKADLEAAIAKFGAYTTTMEITALEDSLNAAYDIAKASVAKYEEIVLTDGKSYPTIGENLNAATFGEALPLVQAGYNFFKSAIEASDATYTDLDANLAKLKKYASVGTDEDENTVITGAYENYNNMLAYANSANAEVASAIAGTKKSVDAIMIAQFATTTEADSAIALMNKAVLQAAATEGMANHGADYTDFITNPTIEGSSNSVVPEGWTCDRPVGDKYTTTGQAYTGESTDRYLDCWQSTAGTVRYTASQILNVPNGTYELKAMTRGNGNHAYLFALPGDDVVNGTFVEFDNNGDVGGGIWEALNARVDANEDLSEEELDMWSVHSSTGYGWTYKTVQVTVTDHILTIGITCDNEFFNQNAALAEVEAFDGNWFSADNFTLTLIGEVQEDANWSPITGIENVTAEGASKAVDGIYTINGQKVARANAKGVYVIKNGNNVQKVIVK